MGRDISPGRTSSGDDDVNKLWEQLRQKDAHLQLLQKQLAHYRSWAASLQAHVQATNPQAIRNSKRLYIGGVPHGTTSEELCDFFTTTMLQAGGMVGPGQGVLGCEVCPDKHYAFLEMRSVEEASNAMALDGIQFKDVNLKVRRPSNYDPELALLLGPPGIDPLVNTASLNICRTLVEDTWNKVFVGGLPSDWTDEQVKDLLAPFGALKSFNLVMDKVTGKSKGYAFCEFVDEAVTPRVIESLHLKMLNRKVLTVKRALEGSRQGGGKQPLGAPLGSLTQLQLQTQLSGCSAVTYGDSQSRSPATPGSGGGSGSGNHGRSAAHAVPASMLGGGQVPGRQQLGRSSPSTSPRDQQASPALLHQQQQRVLEGEGPRDGSPRPWGDGGGSRGSRGAGRDTTGAGRSAAAAATTHATNRAAPAPEQLQRVLVAPAMPMPGSPALLVTAAGPAVPACPAHGNYLLSPAARQLPRPGACSPSAGAGRSGGGMAGMPMCIPPGLW